MPTLKGTEVSLPYVHCFLYLVFSSINVSMFHSTWLDTFWTDLLMAFLNKEERCVGGGDGERGIRFQK